MNQHFRVLPEFPRLRWRGSLASALLVFFWKYWALEWLDFPKVLVAFFIATELTLIKPSPGSMTPLRC
jgi:hypothetical protein